MTERLDKFLSNQKIGSRKEVAQFAKKGMISVNGEVIKKADIKIDPENDEIAFQGQPITYRKFIYIMMNKPKGVVSATEDGRDRTVVDLLPDEWKRKGIFPAGRLDRNTTGLLVITNDGDMAHKMLAPKSHVYKIYRAELEKPVSVGDKEAFEKGIKYGEIEFLPAELRVPDENEPNIALVRIREGKFHQIKRMFEALDNKVVELKRLSVGGLRLDETLEEGGSRLLDEKEIDKIFNKVIELYDV